MSQTPHTTTAPPSARTLDGARVLITGGAGFIGSTIADQLIEANVAEVRVIDNFVRGRRANLAAAEDHGNVNVVRGDIRDRALMRALLDGVDVVYHEAAIRITQCAEEPRLALETMVDGAFDVFEAAVDAGVQRLVYASSASVYGMAREFPTTESHHAYDNRTLYGAAKLFNEGLARSFHDMYDIETVGLRYFNVFGPRMDVHGVYTEVLVRWMERIAAGQPPLILGDGLQTMDFVFIDDVARANVLAATAPVVDSVYNVAYGVETSLRELARVLLEVMGRPDLEPEFGPARSVNNVARRLADTSAAERDLNFRARVDLRTGLERLVAWWRLVRDHGLALDSDIEKVGVS